MNIINFQKNKLKIILLIWILSILSIYLFHLDYHFKGKKQKIKNTNQILNELSKNNLIQKSNFLNSNKWKFVLFAHPECPCTIASIKEFKNLTTKYKFESIVIFSNSETESTSSSSNSFVLDNEFNDNSILTDKLKIKSIKDINNSIISKFKFNTSGYTLLFDNNDNLVYSGGVTPYRGHIGKSELHLYLEDLSKSGQININRSDTNINVLSNIFSFLTNSTDINLKSNIKKEFIFKKTINSVVYGCSL